MKRKYQKLFYMIVTVLMSFSMIIPSSAVDVVYSPITIIDNIPPAVSAILVANPGLTVDTTTPLYNTDEEIVAYYYTLSPIGYAIISTQGETIEYSPTVGREIPLDERVYYAGPLSYFTKDANGYVDVYSGVVYAEDVIGLACESYSVIAENMAIETNMDIGIATAATTYPITLYTNYVPTPYCHTFTECTCGYESICGTVAAAMFLKYYNDYITPGIVPTWIPDPATEENSFIHYLISYIQANGPDIGTYAFEVRDGINLYIQHHHQATTYYGYQAAYDSGITFEDYQYYIYTGRPVVLLLNGAPMYEDHWVLGYGYTSMPGSTVVQMSNYCIVCDGWGNSGIHISDQYIRSLVYMDYVG